jgi:uncharacterized protein YukE
MSELRANEADVRYDFEAADRLAARFRSTAAELDGQIGWRNSLAGAARQEWRGRFAEQFDGRIRLCTDDGKALAEGMRTAAAMVDDLSRRAREEQARIEAARAYFDDQKSMNPIDWLWDKFDDWWSGPDVPSVLQATDPPAQIVPLDRHIAADRE